MWRRRKDATGRDVTSLELLEAGYERVEDLVELQRRLQLMGADLLVTPRGPGSEGYVYRIVGTGPTIRCGTLDEVAERVTRLEQPGQGGPVAE